MDFYNPHSADFIFIPLSYRILGKKPLLKYSYLGKIKLKNQKFVFDFRESSFFTKKFIKKYFYLLIPILFVEIIFWCSLNKISIKKICFVSKKLNNSNSKLFLMTYKSMADLDERTENFFNSYGHIYAHLTHYFIRTKEKAENILKLKAPITLLGDSNFSQNSYYLKYFQKKKINFEILPFRPDNRFFLKDSSSPRLRRLYSGGTTHQLQLEKPKNFYEDFRTFFGVNAYHTVRPYLLNHKLNFLDVSQTPWSDQAKMIRVNSHFKNDLVGVFNRYLAVTYGSELSGAPSISNLEAICCGAIALIDKKYVEGLPLIEGIDFIHIDEHAKNIQKELKKAFELLLKRLPNLQNTITFRERFDFFLNQQIEKIFI